LSNCTSRGKSIIINGKSGKLLPFKGIRKKIAQRLRYSLDTAVQANHKIAINMSNILKNKKELKEKNVDASITVILLMRVAITLKETPFLNSTLVEDGIFILDDVNIGVAVTNKDKLIVPVIKNVDKLKITDICKKYNTLMERINKNSLRAEDMVDGTFTVSNLGMYGINSFTSIINPPEAGILAVGNITQTPVVKDGKILIQPLTQFSLTYDHRIIDGALAARFLQKLKNTIES